MLDSTCLRRYCDVDWIWRKSGGAWELVTGLEGRTNSWGRLLIVALVEKHELTFLRRAGCSTLSYSL